MSPASNGLSSRRAIAIRRARLEPGVRLPSPNPGTISMQVLLPPGWPRPKGYANGVTAKGRLVFVAGMIGWDANGVFHTDDLAGQVHQALQNIVEVLKEGGAKPEHIVRMTWYVTDKREYVAAYPEIGKAFRQLIGSFNAAMTAVEVNALVEDRAKVEIEVTAVVPD
jgi:enamine deaminase RidA (YjgF/YER057c/UK114 family)